MGGRIHVGTAVVDCLATNGIDTLFGIPGKQTLPLNEAIEGRDDVEFVVARHETAVTHQAWGYAETIGDPAATVVIPGPGDMNAMNGLKNALNDCTPLVHVAVETDPELRGGDDLHETPPDTYDNVVKENILVENAASTAVAVERAVAIARTPPKGLVRVGIPRSFVDRDRPLAAPGGYRPGGREPPTDDEVDAAADLLAGTSAPVVVAGGGVRTADATDELLRVARRLDAPLVPTYKAKGAVPEDDPLFAGVLSAAAAPELLDCLASADAALGVGTDFDAVTTRSWSVDLPEEFVHVTLDPDDLGTGYDPAVGIVADAGETLAALAAALPGRSGDGRDRAAAVRRATRDRLADLRTGEPPFTSVAVLSAVRDAVPRGVTVTVDAGGFRMWALHAFEAYGPRSYVNPGSWASMGTGLPSGIGAQLADPDDPTVVLTGDGGLLMCVHELHTAAVEEIPLLVVVLNNCDYASISDAAARAHGFDENAYGWPSTPVQFADIAEGMGVDAVRVDDLGALRTAVDEWLNADGPALVEVPTDPDEPQAGEWLRE